MADFEFSIALYSQTSYDSVELLLSGLLPEAVGFAYNTAIVGAGCRFNGTGAT
jgi:hypothetical protein